jgi:lipoprotein-releasing system permease protein
MLDINVVLIIGLMILISIINMVSALLITILEKRADVGLLKALGLRDSKVIMTFVNYSAQIILTGFFAGNIIGFGVCLAQTSTGIITLDPAAYYISVVPMKLDLMHILSIQLLAFACCVIAMFLPALYSTIIQPSTALRLNE